MTSNFAWNKTPISRPAAAPRDEGQILGHSFRDRSLLRRALTHRSADSSHYERLEFLGDAVLELVITELLYRCSSASEGDMTRARITLVNNQRLVALARKQGLEAYLRLGQGEKSKEKLPDSIMADAMEALIGAIYLDAGLDACERAVRKLYEDVFTTKAGDLVAVLLEDTADSQEKGKTPKSRLQERLQAAAMPLPEYSLIKAWGAGPESHHLVACEAYLGEYCWKREGQGRSRREAEQAAAAEVLRAMPDYIVNKRPAPGSSKP